MERKGGRNRKNARNCTRGERGLMRHPQKRGLNDKHKALEPTQVGEGRGGHTEETLQKKKKDREGN